MERIYGRIRHLGRKGEFRECKRSDQRIREGILTRYRRRGAARTQKRNVPTGRTARKIHGKEVIRMVRQVIQPRILGKVREKLEMMEGQETY